MSILPTAKGIGQAITDIGGSGTITVLAGIAGFVFLTIIIGVDYIWHARPPSEGWVVPYSFCAAFAGVGAAIKGVHRATAKAEIVEAEAKAEATKKLASAQAEAIAETERVRRSSGAHSITGDRPIVTDHDNGIV